MILQQLRSRVAMLWAGADRHAHDYRKAIAATGRDLGNYFEQVATNYRPVANPFFYYQRFIDRLRQVENLDLRPLQDFLLPIPSGMRALSLRHDVDADPLTALRCARYLARYGVASSFYLLHSAIYYGEFYGDRFVRTGPLAQWVQALLVAGCELGLHNDALGVYRQHGVDGARALAQEIAWFRDLGVQIRGTVAHNSGPIYGAENYEIFRGRVLWRRTVSHDGGVLPLGSLGEAKLGLTYEGTFANPKTDLDVREAAAFFQARDAADLQSAQWMRRYLLHNPCCDWLPDFQFWLIGKDRWVIAGRWQGEETFAWEADFAHVLERIFTLPVGSRSVCVIHPEIVRGDQ